MDQLQVIGRKIDTEKVKNELCMSKFMYLPGFRRLYCVTPPYDTRVSTVNVQIKRKVKKSKKSKKVSQKRREEKLYEILSSTVQVKMPPLKARTKHPLPVSTKLYPDYKIHNQIYKNRKLSLSQIREKFYKTNQDKNDQEDLFDLSVLLPIINTAYTKLYEEDLDLLKTLVNEEETIMKKIEKPTLRIKDECVERIIYSDNDDDLGPEVDLEEN
uniref:Uncharacterized protein n=1 Tax=Rhodnius prolixus TaxID=13249 RepID=T1HXF6_RHOPR